MRVLISTVYGFRELRSAQKFWLEEYGSEVWISEFEDFPPTPLLQFEPSPYSWRWNSS